MREGRTKAGFCWRVSVAIAGPLLACVTIATGFWCALIRNITAAALGDEFDRGACSEALQGEKP